MREITVHELLSHQEPIASHPARFKVVRAGRRFGKDGLAENVSLLGHGPDVGGVPRWKGLVHGYDVVWLAPTIPQAMALWKNEVEPRFRHKPGVDVNKVEKTVTFLNPDGTPYATLWVRSAEAIDSVRGIGKRLGGVVINEAAWMNLETAWRDVLRPTLMDCGGWALIMSTTNAGPDGFEDEAGKRSPSFFNLLCEQIQTSVRGPEWAEFAGDARDNPKITAEEFEALVAEYPPDSPTLAQEVFAKLIAAGAGVAFPEWDADVHTTSLEPERASGEWRWWASGDWGFAKPGWLGLSASTSNQDVTRYEFYYRETPPYQVGFTFGKNIMAFPRCEYVALDSACWNVNDGGPTIAEEIQRGLKDACGKFAPPVISAPKGTGSRITGKLLVHQALKYTRETDGTVKQWNRPRWQIHKSCTHLIRTLPKLPRDPKNPEDVDTDAEDHPYDGARYGFMARVPKVDAEVSDGFDENKHPGFTKSGERAKPWLISPDEIHAPKAGRYARPENAQRYAHAGREAGEGFEW